jgi:hypothetical protein
MKYTKKEKEDLAHLDYLLSLPEKCKKEMKIPPSIPSMSCVLGIYPNEQSCYASLFDMMTRDGYKLDMLTGKYRKP